MVVEAKQQLQKLKQFKEGNSIDEMAYNSCVKELQRIDNDNMLLMKNVDYQKVGRYVKNALMKAKGESRLIIGLSGAIKVLSHEPQGSLFCFIAASSNSDAATHMHEVLLEAFCYENDIYVIKVDSPLKLSRILGITSVETCCLIQKKWAINNNNNHNNNNNIIHHHNKQSNNDDHNNYEELNKAESFLVDYCEAFWDSSTQTIIQLPNV